MKNLGFTLMELMIAIVILGILVTIAFPLHLRAVERSRMSEAYLHLEQIKNAEYAYNRKYDKYADKLSYLTIDDPNGLPNRFFNYTEDIVTVPVGTLKIEAVRNNFNNVLGKIYHVWIDQDGRITDDF